MPALYDDVGAYDEADPYDGAAVEAPTGGGGGGSAGTPVRRRNRRFIHTDSRTELLGYGIPPETIEAPIELTARATAKFHVQLTARTRSPALLMTAEIPARLLVSVFSTPIEHRTDRLYVQQAEATAAFKVRLRLVSKRRIRDLEEELLTR